MTTFESTITLTAPVEKVYSFLADLNNHQQLMPPSVYNWSSTADEARFTIQNMAKLAVKVSSRVENDQITIIPSEAGPFHAELTWKLSATDASSTKAIFTIKADLNMMMKMLASGPLQKLADHQTSALKEALK
jgi:carbon monoxide dehydrogenase subunit G